MADLPSGDILRSPAEPLAPTLIAESPQDALDALFMLPGAHYADPLLSWRFVVEPAALGFLRSRALGPQYENDMFVGGARDLPVNPLDGHLFHVKLTGNRASWGLRSSALNGSK